MPESAVLVVVVEVDAGCRLWLVNAGYARQGAGKNRVLRRTR